MGKNLKRHIKGNVVALVGDAGWSDLLCWLGKILAYMYAPFSCLLKMTSNTHACTHLAFLVIMQMDTPVCQSVWSSSPVLQLADILESCLSMLRQE